MKRIKTILIAGLALIGAVSCVKEQHVIFDASKAEAPVILDYNYTPEDGITVNFTPGSYGQSFNQNMPVTHSLILVNAGNKVVNRLIASTTKGSPIAVSASSLSRTLIGLGFEEGDQLSLDLALRMSMQEGSRDNLRNGFAQATGEIGIPSFEVVVPKGSPYEGYDQLSEWTVIGSLSAYEMSWDKDLVMWTDGNGKHVAAHVKLTADDQFKFRKDESWDVNLGGTFAALDAEFSVEGNGANIIVGTEGYYDLFVDTENNKAWVSAAYDPYPEYTQTSAWSVIGALSKYDISWNGDLAMITDGTNHVALSVSLAEADEFKFRKDASWDVNLGGTFSAMDEDFTVEANGANIVVGTEGVFDLFVNPDAGTAKVTKATGAKVSYIKSTPEPEPEPEPEEVKGWNVIGLNGDWNNDILATQDGNIWTAYITAEGDTEFKWRKDGGWDENYGGVMAAFGEPFAAEAGGANINIGAGFYKVVLDTDALTITVFNDFTVWGMIGVNGDWNNDIYMTEKDGKWVSPVIKISGEFKIRKNHGWDDNRGGTFAEVGVPFEVTPGGSNIAVPEGEYIVTYDPAAETIVVDAALPSNTWSLIGVNGDWNNDIFMTELMPGIWVSPEVEITNGGWKLRFNHDWAVNRGGATPPAEGVFVKAVQNGDNVGLQGKFKVVYNANNDTFGTLVWGVVGSVASIEGFSWNNDIPMNLASDGKWYSIPVALSTGDQFKLRQGAAWDVNRGGTCAAANESFDVAQNGDNISAPADGTYMLVYDPAAETITLSTQFWGLIGVNGDWNNDIFMFFDGAKWAAYGKAITGDWKLRQGAGWDVNRGGTFSAAGEAFAVEQNGSNINAGDVEVNEIVYDPAAETVTVN